MTEPPVEEPRTVRAIIAEQIRTDNPSWLVREYASPAPDALSKGKVFCSVSRASLVPREQAYALTHNIIIEVLVSSQGATTEDDSDEALDRVLLSLQRIPGVSWDRATRAAFDSRFFGYQVEASADSKNVYRQQVIEELQEGAD